MAMISRPVNFINPNNRPIQPIVLSKPVRYLIPNNPRVIRPIFPSYNNNNNYLPIIRTSSRPFRPISPKFVTNEKPLNRVSSNESSHSSLSTIPSSIHNEENKNQTIKSPEINRRSSNRTNCILNTRIIYIIVILLFVFFLIVIILLIVLIVVHR